MPAIRSQINAVLRRLASPLSPKNQFRLFAARLWTQLLNKTGDFVEVPVAGMQLNMLNQFRQISPDYEAQTLKLWQTLIKPGMVVWDVGANIGLYSVISAKLVGKNGLVHAWEPTPSSFQVASRHVSINHTSAYCHVHQAAVGDVDGSSVSFSLVSAESTDPTNRLGSKLGQTIQVPVVTLDGELARQSRRPDFVKIDIEGAEILALRGAEQLMTRDDARPMILLAVHPMFLPEFNSSPGELFKLIQERNYTCYTMSGVATTELDYDEYLLVSKEKIEELCKDVGW